MSKIDTLYKRAFGTDKHEYNDANWEKMESLLDDVLPVKESTSWLSRAASFALVAGLTLVGTLFIDQSPELLETDRYSQTQNEGQDLKGETAVPSNDRDLVKTNNKIVNTTSSMRVVKYTSPVLASTTIPGKEDVSKTSSTLAEDNFAPNRSVLTISSNSATPSGLVHVAGLSNSLASAELENSIVKLGLSLGKKPISIVNEPSKIERTNTPAPAIRSMTSLEFMSRPDLVLDVESMSLLSYQPAKGKRIKYRVSPKVFTELAVVSEQLDNDLDLNIYVSEEIKNVALVNMKNNNSEVGMNLGFKWKGLVVSSGVFYKKHSAAYRLYYSHTRNWEEQNIQTETTMEVDSTFIRTDVILPVDGETTYTMKDIYQVDSTYYTTSDTTRIARSSTDELDEYFDYKIRYVSIPLNIGYEHQISRFFVSVNVGMNMSFLANASGSIYNSRTNQVESFVDKQDLNSVLYTANASVGVGYNFSPQLSLAVQPRLSKALNSTFKSTSDFATTYMGYGANFALRYSF
tara:strand:- start:23287 stop:24840 length:1554 start_codon:yes stop_codon:yes gene_type:complete